MQTLMRPIEELSQSEDVKEVELMLTTDELNIFAQYCLKHDLKFNDWIRQLAYTALEKDKSSKIT